MKKMKTPPPTFPLARFLKLWPGLIALLSLLALWGEGAVNPGGGRPERGPRPLLSAGQVASPEVRAVPAPTPGPGLLGSPEAPPSAVLPVPGSQAEPVLGQAQRGAPYPDLKLLGRYQTDGA